jgi:hypothetical protein
MSELQFGLIAVGALVVAGVFLYNKWQEQRYQRDAEAAFGARHDDVLMRSGGQAPPARSPERIEPSLASSLGGPGPEVPARQVLVESVDFIIPIEGAEDVAGTSVLDAAGATLDRCPRSVHLEGFDEKLAAWELVDPDRSYSRMRAGLQLVDRRGPADAEEVAAFGAAVEEVAASIGSAARSTSASRCTWSTRARLSRARRSKRPRKEPGSSSTSRTGNSAAATRRGGSSARSRTWSRSPSRSTAWNRCPRAG